MRDVEYVIDAAIGKAAKRFAGQPFRPGPLAALIADELAANATPAMWREGMLAAKRWEHDDALDIADAVWDAMLRAETREGQP